MCVIEKVGALLVFVDIGYAVEKEHLKEPSEKDSTQEKETIKRMVAEGKTYRVIASELGVTLGKVQRALKT